MVEDRRHAIGTVGLMETIFSRSVSVIGEFWSPVTLTFDLIYRNPCKYR